MKHVTILPDCPQCENEMQQRSTNLPPFDDAHPWGSGKRYWYYCQKCDISSPAVEVRSGENYYTARKEATRRAFQWARQK